MAGRPRLLTRRPGLAGTLDRPRLIDRAGAAPLVVVAAPAGSGTTTAAAQIAASDERADGRAVAWVRLADGYTSAADVVAMVVATLRRDGDEDGADGVDQLTGRTPLVDLAESLLDRLDAHPATVVVDDLHLADADVDRLLAECVGVLPAGSRFVVASATRPAGLLGLAAPTSVVMLDVGDLAFTDVETAALFASRNAPADRAEVWHRTLGGWASGIAAGATAPDSDPDDHVAALLERAHDITSAGLLDVLAALPYVTSTVVSALDPTLTVAAATDALIDLATRSPLVTDHGGYVRLSPAAADRHRATLPVERVVELRRQAAPVIAEDDPTTAIDVLLDADEPEAAADVLADHLSEIGVERALTWLYRLPPDLRRRFPPVLAAGQATVEVDSALAAARARVEDATNERSRREALLALGSIEAHRGELPAAATALEQALRSGRDDPDFTARTSLELARTRWLLGDLDGAASALERAVPGGERRWLSAVVAVGAGRAPTSDDGETPAPAADETAGLYAVATEVLARLVDDDDPDIDRDRVDRAFTRAGEIGGDVLAAVGPVAAWTALRSDDPGRALEVVERFERVLGPRHRLGRVHGAIVRERVSRTGSGDHDRDVRRLRDLRATGFATVERLAERALGPPDGAAGDTGGAAQAAVTVLGEHGVRLGPTSSSRSDWTSKKALEVLTVVADAGSRGRRRDEVIEAVWPGRDPDRGRPLLRRALSDIRRMLEPDRPAGEAAAHLTTSEDVISTDLVLDLDEAERLLDADPAAAFRMLRPGLAVELVDTEWGDATAPRVERLRTLAAQRVAGRDGAPVEDRSAALEVLIEAEPWQRAHYDALATLHREAGDEAAADDVERRWFADDD